MSALAPSLDARAPGSGSAHSTPPLAPAAASRLRAALNRVNELWDDEEAVVAARAAKRSAAKAPVDKATTRACGACRKAKNRCLSASADEVCPRCKTMGLDCVYPELRARGPKKRLSKTHRLLQDIKRDLEAVLSGSSTVDPLDEDSEEEGSLGEDARSQSAEAVQLDNPLAVLAQKACEAAVPAPPSSPRAHRPAVGERYYDGGLYLSRPETDFSLDPVEAGVLTVVDLTRLAKLYFSHLRPFFFLLLPELHTVNFLRQNSPFLTTSLAFVAATFDPLSAHITPSLSRHVRRIMLDILDSGLRSIEIVQSFFILSHWASPDIAHETDRAWQWLGQAWRTATELRIDLQLDDLAFTTYREASAIGLDLVNKNRKLTWNLLFCGELAMSVQTGRAECSRAPPVPAAASLSPSKLPLEFPEYNHAANLQVNWILTRAIHLAAGLRQEDASAELREAFQSFWKPEMEAWRLRWPDINPFIDVHAENNVMIMNLMALRFPGASTHAILADCKAAAIRTIQKVSSWEDRETQLPYASNYVIVHIAYGAVLLLQLSQRFHQGVSTEMQSKILRIATVLERIGKNRPNAPSFATLHADRLRRLVASLTLEPARAASPPAPPAVSWSGPPMPPVIPLPPRPPPASSFPFPSPYCPSTSLDALSAAAVASSADSASVPTDFGEPFPSPAGDFDLAPMMSWWGWGEPDGALGDAGWAMLAEGEGEGSRAEGFL